MKTLNFRETNFTKRFYEIFNKENEIPLLLEYFY